jgi:hypothetical protein
VTRKRKIAIPMAKSLSLTPHNLTIFFFCLVPGQLQRKIRQQLFSLQLLSSLFLATATRVQCKTKAGLDLTRQGFKVYFCQERKGQQKQR